MDFLILLLATCCMIFQANAQYQPYNYNNLYRYPNYPVIAGPIHHLDPQNRLFWTWTSTTTSTSVTTCTVSTSVLCPGRRKKFLTEDLDAIHQSSVKTLETTRIATEFSARKEREADFDTLWTDPATYEIQSTIGNPNLYSNYNPYFREPFNNLAVGPRFFLRVTTSTTITVSTYTLRPACYSGSGFNQC